MEVRLEIPEKSLKSFGGRVLLARLALSLQRGRYVTQGDVADAMEVTAQSAQKWENADDPVRMEVERQFRLADYFGVRHEWLFANRGPMLDENLPGRSAHRPAPADSTVFSVAEMQAKAQQQEKRHRRRRHA